MLGLHCLYFSSLSPAFSTQSEISLFPLHPSTEMCGETRSARSTWLVQVTATTAQNDRKTHLIAASPSLATVAALYHTQIQMLHISLAVLLSVFEKEAF